MSFQPSLMPSVDVKSTSRKKYLLNEETEGVAVTLIFIVVFCLSSETTKSGITAAKGISESQR